MARNAPPPVNWYKHYLGDYARDTGHLTITEHGVYRLLLDHYYATEGDLPTAATELEQLCRARTKADRKAVETIAAKFFPVNGTGSRHNHRADREIARWQSQAKLNRELGKKGGRPRKTESVSESETEPKPNRNPNQIPDTRVPEEATSTTTARDAKRPRTRNNRIGYDWQTHKFTGIGDEELMAWQEAHPAISVPDQLERAGLWLKANPTKRKSNYERFILNWLSRAQDRGAPIK